MHGLDMRLELLLVVTFEVAIGAGKPKPDVYNFLVIAHVCRAVGDKVALTAENGDVAVSLSIVVLQHHLRPGLEATLVTGVGRGLMN